MTSTGTTTLAAARRAGRYSVRLTGTKFDYTRRYTIIDKTTGRVARNLTHGATYQECDAQEVADRANGIDAFAYDEDEA